MLKLLRKHGKGVPVLGIDGNLLYTFLTAGKGSYKSTDLVNYEVGNAGGYYVYGSAFGNGKLVIVGYDGVAFFVKSTNDGVNWVNAIGTGLGAPELTDITYGNGKFVAISKNNQIYYSTDAVNWTKPTTPFTSSITNANKMAHVGFGNGLFIATSTDNKTARSTDGINWTLGQAIRGMRVSYVNGMWHMASSYDDYRYWSMDGITWTAAGFFSVMYSSNVVYANGRYLMIRSDGYVYTSTDGKNWAWDGKPALSPFNRIGGSKLSAKGDILAYGGSNGKLHASLDGGVNWTAYSLGFALTDTIIV